MLAVRKYGYTTIMKATIDVPDRLYREIKAEAALRGLTVREVTTRLYRRWLSEGEGEEAPLSDTGWPHTWFRAADEAMKDAPPGPTAVEHLEAGRNRLESGKTG